tara:strand:- start:70 stop:483 length:414 start_codon:yes stop_codon:yes gene_type:complete
MEDTLKIKIVNLLKKRDLLSFTSDNARQGGPLVNIVLNNKSIGEVYTYNSTENRYENIPQGNLLELELANALEEWIHFDFFQFVCENDHLLSDFHDCSFSLKEENIILEITVQKEEEEEEEEIIYESFEYFLTDIVT